MVASRYIFCQATLVQILHACNFIFLNFQFSVHKLKSPQDPTPKKNPSSSQIFFPSMSVITAIDFLLFLCPFVQSLHRFSTLKSQYVSSLFFSLPSGFFAVWLLYCWIVINLVLLLFSYWFRRVRYRHRWGLGPFGPFLFSLSRLIFKKKKKKGKKRLRPPYKKLGPLWNGKPLTQKKKKRFSPKM